jgi:hypothetical protein
MDWRWFIFRFLLPALPWRALPAMIAWTLGGALVAGLYGILHDQVTWTIGPEYFTRLKFDQFAWADPGWGGPRVFAGIIGFLATWWVGAMVAWILCRVSLWHGDRLPATGEMGRAFAAVFVVSMLTAAGGWAWGQRRKSTGYDEGWNDLIYSLGVTTPEAFMTVAYIHNASYLGGMLGMTVALVWLAGMRRKRLASPAG